MKPDSAPQLQLPVMSREERLAEAMDAGSGFASRDIRQLVGEQLVLGEIEEAVQALPTVEPDASVPATTHTGPATTTSPKSAQGRRSSRPPKYDATDRDMEIAEGLNGPQAEPGYIPDASGPGIEEARQMAIRLGKKAVLHRKIRNRHSRVSEIPAALAGHEDRHAKAIEKPFMV